MKLGVRLVSSDIPGGPAAIAPLIAWVGEAAERAGVTNPVRHGSLPRIDGKGRARQRNCRSQLTDCAPVARRSTPCASADA